MILKKPFAFFIRHFKLIHLILTVCAIFLIIKTNSILSFYLEYMDMMSIASGTSISKDLFSLWLLICIILIIIGSILIAGLMKNKDKPIAFYVINILIYAFLAIVYVVSYSVTKTLEIGLVDIRTLKMVQDFLVMAIILQSFSTILLGIRALGFDVKKFDFERDLEELEVTDQDNEEIELNVEFDFDRFKRNWRKRTRYFKYVYLENKVMINIVFGGIIIVLGALVYLKIGVYDRAYKENQNFNVTNYQLNIKKSYIVNKDYNGNVIDDETVFVIADINLKSNSSEEIKFESARIALKINDHLFYHQKKYKNTFNDLGNIYLNQEIGNENSRYLLVFEIPYSYRNKKMKLKYFDHNNKEISINISPETFSNPKLYNYELGDMITFSDSILGNTKLQMTQAEIKGFFKNEYAFCYSNDECIASHEYLVPTYTGNEDKSLIKLVGKLDWDENNKIVGINDLYKFISVYGKLTYVLDDTEKEMNINLKQVKPNKRNVTDTYYIEVSKEVERAQSIYIIFTIRDKVYKYAVK